MRLLPFACAVSAVSAAPVFPPSLQKISVGVNLLSSQPDGLPDRGSDPAFSTLSIFNFSTSNTRTWGGEWLVPAGLVFRPAPSCAYTSTAETIRSSLGFMQSLHEWAIQKTRFLWWTHTVDHEFEEISSQTLTSSFVLVKAKAACTAYQTSVDAGALTAASLSIDFAADVVSLIPTVYGPDVLVLMREFVERWGTSYLDSAVLGGSATIQTTFTQENYTALERESTNMAQGAALNFLAAFGDSDLASDKNFESYVQFAASAVSESVMFVGPRPPSNATDAHINATAWASDILLPNGAPEVVSYTVAPLSDLVSRSDLFPSSSPADAAARGANLARFLDSGDFCTVSTTPCASITRNSFWL